VLSTAFEEYLIAANMAFSMYPGLTLGAISAITAVGSAEQKRTFLPALIGGQWTGTMNLTEPHCGTDLGLLRTRAEPSADGTYRITGTKIFISAGEHDLSENIIHLVLAKMPDSPDSVKGISLFIVPKFLLDEAGRPGVRNAVSCGAIEDKMGIHGNATCVMNYDGATGYLIGEKDKGLRAMFIMMNAARLGVGMQGLAMAEVATQNAARYAAQNAVMNIAQTAFSQVAAAVPTPGSGPAQMLNQAADTTDQIAALIASLTGGEEAPTDKR
jgi:alkylation response protein AidB-like acyl-CoA dehydrogenase